MVFAHAMKWLQIAWLTFRLQSFYYATMFLPYKSFHAYCFASLAARQRAGYLSGKALHSISRRARSDSCSWFFSVSPHKCWDIIHLPCYHATLYCVAIDSVAEKCTEMKTERPFCSVCVAREVHRVTQKQKWGSMPEAELICRICVVKTVSMNSVTSWNLVYELFGRTLRLCLPSSETRLHSVTIHMRAILS